MKTLLTTTALVLTVVGISFANSIPTNDQESNAVNVGSLSANSGNTNSNNVDQSNANKIGSDNETTNYNGTYVSNSGTQANGYVSNPNLTTSGADTCFGSSSGGISAAGIGISGGSTKVDENCVMLKNAKLLSSLGLKDAAVALLINSNSDIAKAISQAYPQLVIKLSGVINAEDITDNMSAGGLY